MSDPAAVVESLTHRYGERMALDNVSLQVAPHTIFGLLGPNGGGKTTLFRILSTLIRPQTGKVQLLGLDPITRREEIRRRIGVVFQSPSLDKKLTVFENLRHQGHLYGLQGAKLRERIQAMLERFALQERTSEYVETLSGGLRRRVELAKGLLHRPDLLLLDEPSTGLDPRARRELMDHLRELRDTDGVTILMTTHLMEEADRCDRLAILDHGRVVRCDTPDALKASIGGDVIAIETKQPDHLRDQIAVRFNLAATILNGTVRLERSRGHEFVPTLVESFPRQIDAISVGKPTLDDVFIHLTGHRLDDNE